MIYCVLLNGKKVIHKVIHNPQRKEIKTKEKDKKGSEKKKKKVKFTKENFYYY